MTIYLDLAFWFSGPGHGQDHQNAPQLRHRSVARLRLVVVGLGHLLDLDLLFIISYLDLDLLLMIIYLNIAFLFMISYFRLAFCL